MATAFKQIADNAVSTTATTLTSTGVISITAATGTGALFPTPGNGYWLTIWTGATGSDPGADANMEKVTVSARSGDVLTISATTKTHAAPVNIGLLDVSQNTADLQTAVNNLENGINNASVVGNEQPVGLVNGSNTAYTTASNMATGSLKVFRNGIRLKGGGVDFTQGSGNAFTMVTAPNTGDLLLVDYNVSATGFSVGTNSNIYGELPTGTINGTTTAFTLTRAYIAGSLAVYIDGVRQSLTADYTETTPASGIFTFTVAPLTGQKVTVDYQFNLNPSSNADTVDGIHASSTATAGQLMPLDGAATFPQTLLQTGVLGYAQITSALTTTSTTYVQATGLTSAVTIPALPTGRKLKITAFLGNVSESVIGTLWFSIWDGTVGTGTQLAESVCVIAGASYVLPVTVVSVISAPAAGSKTYNVGWKLNNGTGTIACTATSPAFILVELI